MTQSIVFGLALLFSLIILNNIANNIAHKQDFDKSDWTFLIASVLFWSIFHYLTI